MNRPIKIAGVLNRKKSRETVYLAGPLSQNKEKTPRDWAITSMGFAAQLRDVGLQPFIPHLCVWWEELHPAPYERWMDYDFVWLKRCDALFRMPGHSPGADREVAFAKQNGIPVFFSLEAVILWARK